MLSPYYIAIWTLYGTIIIMGLSREHVHIVHCTVLIQTVYKVYKKYMLPFLNQEVYKLYTVYVLCTHCT